jgi:hypothetical protein
MGDAAGAGDGEAAYDCEECVVHGGQRAQRIAPAPGTRAGLYQRLGANPRWTYQLSMFAFLEPGLKAWLGIDPNGGDDPGASAIRWTSAQAADEWVQLCTSVVAVAGPRRAVTVFNQVESDRTAGAGYLDDIAFVAMQDLCPPAPVPPPQHERLCVNFANEQPGRVKSVTIKGVQFTTLAGTGLIYIGSAGSQVGLMLTPAGILVRFPYPAARVVARVFGSGGKPASMTVLDAGGNPAGNVEAASTTGPAILELTGSGLMGAQLKGYEAILVELCIERDAGTPPGNDDPPGKL